MKFVTYSLQSGGTPRFGFLKNGYVVDVLRAAIWVQQTTGDSEFLEIPTRLKSALATWSKQLSALRELQNAIPEQNPDTYAVHDHPIAVKETEIVYYPPVPDPSTVRDFYAFEQHVKAARRQRGLDMNELWYKLPVFYFSNPNALYGHKMEIPYPAGTEALDYELELAVIIAQGGRNISAEDAELQIAGYTIMNDWSARDWQQEEMQLNLGPAKGKDFATSLGPWLVTPDELNDCFVNGKLSLTLTASVNDRQLSSGNSHDLTHAFARMIEYASRNANLLPGDIIGSGTVGTGCILELRPENTGGWLKKDDTVRLEIDHLGILENTIG